MRITTQGEYGLRCIINIGKNACLGPVSIQRISEEEGLPRAYVEQLLLKLRRDGLIQSVRGTKGGYVLADAPENITVSQVLKSLEGNVFEIVCDRRIKSRFKCKYNRKCSLNPIWKELKKLIENKLSSYSLNYLIDIEKQKFHSNCP